MGKFGSLTHKASSKIVANDIRIVLLFFKKKKINKKKKIFFFFKSRPRWLSWVRRLTGDQEVAGSTPAKVGNILLWRLIMKYFLRSFSPFR